MTFLIALLTAVGLVGILILLVIAIEVGGTWLAEKLDDRWQR